MTKFQKKAAALARKQARLCSTGEKQNIGGPGAPQLAIPTLPVVRYSIVGRGW